MFGESLVRLFPARDWLVEAYLHGLKDRGMTRSPKPCGEKGRPPLFGRTKKGTGCRRYRVLLEEGGLCGGGAQLGADAKFTSHAWGCVACSKVLDDALLAADLMSHTREFAAKHPEEFATRVMAAIHEESARQAALSAIWRPLELLALRFALVAMAVVMVLSLYLAGFTPPSQVPAITSDTEVGAGFPEPPTQPANQDEVLVSLAGSDIEF